MYIYFIRLKVIVFGVLQNYALILKSRWYLSSKDKNLKCLLVSIVKSLTISNWNQSSVIKASETSIASFDFLSEMYETRKRKAAKKNSSRIKKRLKERQQWLQKPDCLSVFKDWLIRLILLLNTTIAWLQIHSEIPRCENQNSNQKCVDYFLTLEKIDSY